MERITNPTNMSSRMRFMYFMKPFYNKKTPKTSNEGRISPNLDILAIME